MTTTTSTSGSSFDTTLANLGIKRAASNTGTTTASGASTVTGVTKTTLDQSDFLTLLTTQLKNQDPFAPMDNTQMVAQMAQFSSVAGISEMNSTLKSLSTKLGATTATDAIGFVGKTVLTPGNTAYGRSSGGLSGEVELDKDATGVVVTIANANGQTLPHGLGWFVQTYNGEPVVWQFGVQANAASSLVVTLPARNVTLILLANSDGLAKPATLPNGDITVSPFARVFLGLVVK